MNQPKKKRIWPRFAALAAVLILVLGLGAGIGIYRAGHAVASTVSLDVNPSIEIKVNRRQQVLEVVPLNEDAKSVIGGMDFFRSSLDVTVNALIGSMVRNGYLNEAANSILISVDDADAARGKQLEERLAGEINSLLQTDAFDGSVLSQTISADDQLQALADRYGITAGKAKLIQQIVTQDSRYTFESLVPLTINELNLISQSGTLPLEQVTTTGSASDKGYVGRESAKAAALAHAGVAEADVRRWECELDFDDGRMIYEVEFHVDDYEYHYDISAADGSVVKYEREGDDDRQPVTTPAPSPSADPVPSDAPSPSADPVPSDAPTDALIGADAARAAALAHAGVSEADAYDWEVELDRDDGRTVYEIEFHSGRYEYKYDIDAYTGAVLKSEKDWDD